MDFDWFRPRPYKHFDLPVSDNFKCKVVNDLEFVAEHAFSPLIHYDKNTRRYNPETKKTELKKRSIKYASHRDACIYSYYSYQLANYLDDFYRDTGLYDNVIAYRKLGKNNADFANEVFKYANCNSPVYILAFDIKEFFDNLDHEQLKKRLNHVLNTDSLSNDWYAVFKNVTRYHYVELEDIQNHPRFSDSLKSTEIRLIATIRELKENGINIHSHLEKGIPQGTPISAVLSNLYMIDFDMAMKSYCDQLGGFYRRYSDDILVICKSDFCSEVEEKVKTLVEQDKLSLNTSKTEITEFDSTAPMDPTKKSAQYLGFVLYPDGLAIRPSTISRHKRKLQRSIKRASKKAKSEFKAGRSEKIFTKSLYRRFTPVNTRNFYSYGKRCAVAFESNHRIKKQMKKMSRAAQKKLTNLKTPLS